MRGRDLAIWVSALHLMRMTPRPLKPSVRGPLKWTARADTEALGLLALMTFSHARKAARFDHAGAFVPLAQHDVSRWDRDAIVTAEALLMRAASLRRPGPVQLEAAIQSAHCQRLFSGRTPWNAISTLYEALNRLAPNVGTIVAHAARTGP
jgi:RNA polymerase sigma-70 factor (ECF subfamily)